MEEFFGFLKTRIATARKYAPAARDYALFRTLYHAGLRSEEAVRLDRPDVRFGRGPFGKLHVRFGKGARTSGPRPRWVPMLDGLDLVLRWFLDDVRGKFPDSPALFGAGAVIAAMHDHGSGPLSPEAEAARACYEAAADPARAVSDCASGRELAAGGFADDIAIATEVNSSTVVPVLAGQAFTAVS